MNYKRILLKLSGNFFSGKEPCGLDFDAIRSIGSEIRELHKAGVEIAIVCGAGNIFRGRNRANYFDRVAADQIGVIATLPNSLALVETLNNLEVDTRLMCAFEIAGMARRFDVFKARRFLNEKKVLIVAGGTGDAFVTTDTAAVLRALQIKAQVMLKATNVDGVYSEDPDVSPHAKRFLKLTHQDALDKRLGIMDRTALILAQENELPILVFKFHEGSLAEILENSSKGTLITA